MLCIPRPLGKKGRRAPTYSAAVTGGRLQRSLDRTSISQACERKDVANHTCPLDWADGLGIPVIGGMTPNSQLKREREKEKKGIPAARQHFLPFSSLNRAVYLSRSNKLHLLPHSFPESIPLFSAAAAAPSRKEETFKKEEGDDEQQVRQQRQQRAGQS